MTSPSVLPISVHPTPMKFVYKINLLGYLSRILHAVLVLSTTVARLPIILTIR